MDGAPDNREAALAGYTRDHIAGCTRCALCETRTQVVPGNGDPHARLMFVGEAPGYHEDRQGVPFCGAAGRLLDDLLGGIGLTRADVFVANVLKCRPPGNRDPQPQEIAECERHLFRQVSIIRPAMICSLGNFATKLLSGRPDGISRVHGCELPIRVAGIDLLLYPIYHPAAALYAPAMKQVLADDVARIPDLLGTVAPSRPPGAEPGSDAGPAPDGRTVPGDGPPSPPAPDEPPAPSDPGHTQLGLF
ncbi:MAG: uracil-DNA glycosylase [Thermoleophilia bacterium]|nr:uracil-DNA glycosylase [Thermoleophilia bacterium]